MIVLGSILLKSFVNKAQQNMHDQFGQQTNHQSHKSEGEVTIESQKKSNTPQHQIDAEDVDFEEIK